MTDEIQTEAPKKRTVYTLSKWAAEHGYNEHHLALLGADAEKIIPAIKAGERAAVLDDRSKRLKRDGEQAAIDAEKERQEADVLTALLARLDKIKGAAL